jgi:nicotinate-nucleotide adenylyltransferase
VSAVGILGGSFDPVHRGHLALASRARLALGLPRVLFLPCAEPPHKPARRLARRYHRLEMLYLALEGCEGLGVSTYEIGRGGVHYTIDTLRAIRGEDGLQPVFLLGSDALSDVGSWRRYEELLAEFDFGVVARPDAGEGTRAWAEAAAPKPSELTALGSGGRILQLPFEVPAISSSLVRRRSASGDPLCDLVPHSVARYIQRHGLYMEEAHR